ncbi:hypothetical protein EYZ11_008189 [Aspergillus tanneri]|uniref:Ysc84 actin-binding domain-containing protein n=1 Tax=Aspergillus tanneri TaxID=1220188 RepID=A0A4S3JBH9_9EURO|nr:uncharacterized protein ATNIH1004_003009 [Aspergillus tanneri]KAA8650325.1 hypothetical protein ATNIH1004_003009 [Aspergillus tanneri]THC92345.1 hypothetical protein EYZ11_008189 [Aspergillus tanneri]
MPRGMHSPLPASLRSECIKASQILESFINGSFRGSPGKELPARVLASAKGFAIFTASRAGFLGSVRFGSGILIARLDDGSWSAPSAIAIAGIGAGGQFGLELTDFVFMLDDQALHTFSRLGSLTLSGNISIAFGPFGRSAEYSGGASSKGVASMFSYSKTKGIYGGLTIEGGMVLERRSANKKFYQRKVTVNQLLKGEIAPPSEAESLMRVLADKIFSPSTSELSRNPSGSEAAELSGELDAQQHIPSVIQAGLDGNQAIHELEGTPSSPQPAETLQLSVQPSTPGPSREPSGKEDQESGRSSENASGEPSEIPGQESPEKPSKNTSEEIAPSIPEKPLPSDKVTPQGPSNSHSEELASNA